MNISISFLQSFVVAMAALISLSVWAQDPKEAPTVVSGQAEAAASKQVSRPAVHNVRQLHKLILMGKATYSDVRQALSTPNVGELVNHVHALYSMGWHRGTHSLLRAVWRRGDADRVQYPELAWEQLEKPVVRIAVASTLNRFNPTEPEFRAYIRSHLVDNHELHRAQAAVALGLNADPADVDSLLALTKEHNELVVQSAITALGLMKEAKARKALEILYQEHRGSPKGDLVMQVLGHFYADSVLQSD